MKVAITHDFLLEYGDAERVVEALHELWPAAPVFTALHDPGALPESFRGMDVRTSFLQRVPGLARLGSRVYGKAFASFDLRGFDVVVSSSSGWSHGVHTDLDALHVVYCHTPGRGRTAGHANRWLANSDTTRRRLLATYGVRSDIVHPPVDTRRFAIGEPGDYYLCASRLTAHDRVDLVVEACADLGVPLVVEGDGPARTELERLAGADVEFVGRVSGRRRALLVASCRALVVPGEQDFCTAAVEAMAAGRPVVGYARGGLLETVVPDRTGVLFASQTLEIVIGALLRLGRLELDPAEIRRHALRFDTSCFKAELVAIVEEELGIAIPAAAPVEAPSVAATPAAG